MAEIIKPDDNLKHNLAKMGLRLSWNERKKRFEIKEIKQEDGYAKNENNV